MALFFCAIASLKKWTRTQNRYQTLDDYMEAPLGYTAQCFRCARIGDFPGPIQPYSSFLIRYLCCSDFSWRNPPFIAHRGHCAIYPRRRFPCSLIVFGSGLVCTGPCFYGHNSAKNIAAGAKRPKYKTSLNYRAFIAFCGFSRSIKLLGKI